VHALLAAGVNSDLARVITAAEASGAIREIRSDPHTTQAALFDRDLYISSGDRTPRIHLVEKFVYIIS
jgi:hypothetical protein